jgi:hypothetical protein
MSAELETLDQLLGGDLPLRVIRNLYADEEGFRQGILGLLSSGDVCLLMSDQTPVPRWRWAELFAADKVMHELGNMKLRLTAQGTRRIA